MRLTKYGHSCVRIEREGAVLVIDPGVFSSRAALDGVDAVLVTHEHFDHLDVDAVTEAYRKRPGLKIYAHADVASKLDQIQAAVTTVEPGRSFEAAGFAVRAYGGLHAINHPDIPRVANLGYLVEHEIYHPGDSFEVPDDAEVGTLFIPVSAPWLKLSESIEFARAVKPRRAFALHDGILNEAGLTIVNTHLTRLSGTEYRWLEPGTTIS
ncbi:MBL fold metallo-hydrolase [Phytohabitans rumicis]|uniref:MBL fold metallo-hydrolase n=1 Tax=Phytohabitans rumicis TaxID=1076125 RepID=A0A6V8L1W5_9ACTN|nr:MBL fold metallo-hydrolase [Phytohabitans rumicis]GFJ91283.1 MBL fold metallo-hydrolase [Phytohabitans rumicis]